MARYLSVRRRDRLEEDFRNDDITDRSDCRMPPVEKMRNHCHSERVFIPVSSLTFRVRVEECTFARSQNQHPLRRPSTLCGSASQSRWAMLMARTWKKRETRVWTQLCQARGWRETPSVTTTLLSDHKTNSTGCFSDYRQPKSCVLQQWHVCLPDLDSYARVTI